MAVSSSGWVNLLCLPPPALDGVLGRLGLAGVEALGSLDEVWAGPGRRVGEGLLRVLKAETARLERVEEEAATTAIFAAPRLDRWDDFRFEDLTELRDKVHDGIDVLYEHEETRVAPRTRLRLELEMLAKIRSGLDWIADCVRDWDDRDEEKLAAEDRRTRWTISHLDRHYGDIHLRFLEAYLHDE